jgi:poly-gamma-glutamate synthesis protein (capsule biosynthesis protein)
MLIERPDPRSALDQVRDHLAGFDLLFGNCEAPYCRDPRPALTAAVPFFPDVANVAGFDAFDVVSLANNHSLDAGHAGLLETIDRLGAVGVAAVGAGPDIATARRPAVFQRQGRRIAFLAYASVFPAGFEAKEGWPGLAPMRAENHYWPGAANYWYPGMPPRTVTVPLPEDVAALRADLAAVRPVADVVVVSFHWGIFGVPHVVTDHEIRTARFCVDHGADVVVGHHQHTLRAVETYRGKPIFYGLGHFVFDMTNECWQDAASKSFAGGYGISRQPDWPFLQMHPDARASAIAVLRLGPRGLEAGLATAALRRDGSVQLVDPRSEDGERAIDLVRQSCARAGLASRLEFDESLRIGGSATVRAG